MSRTWTEQRTAKNPQARVDAINNDPGWQSLGVSVRIVSIDGETRTGQKRYTVAITDERQQPAEQPAPEAEGHFGRDYGHGIRR